MKIDGKKIANEIAEGLRDDRTDRKYLAAIMVGDDPASAKFVERKRKFAESVGVDLRVTAIEADATTQDVIAGIRRIAEDKECGGIMVQLPLPGKIERNLVLAAIPKEKDVDALIFNDDPNDAIVPPAVATVHEILKNEDISKLSMAVVGVGFLVGGPIAEYFSGKCAALWKIDKDDDISPVKLADVIVLGAGRRGLVTADILKEGAIVIDFGCSFDEEGKICGDFDPQGAEEKQIRYTPTPGGTGPILIAKLFENFYRLNTDNADRTD